MKTKIYLKNENEIVKEFYKVLEVDHNEADDFNARLLEQANYYIIGINATPEDSAAELMSELGYCLLDEQDKLPEHLKDFNSYEVGKALFLAVKRVGVTN